MTNAILSAGPVDQNKDACSVKSVASAQISTLRDILRIAYGFWQSKVLFSAVELNVFTILADGALDIGGSPGEPASIPAAAPTCSTHLPRWACCIATLRVATRTALMLRITSCGRARPISVAC